ncbi:MAG: hypothetical protein JWQ47_830 [Glaciihabitans sp.]|nr:hypothetical protein [Glaciihabitans sp.]
MGYPDRIILTDAAETYLGHLADDVALGIVSTCQLPPSLRAWWWLAYWAGHAAHDADCGTETQRLHWERDLWYFVANNKGKRPSDFYTKTTDALWAGASK